MKRIITLFFFCLALNSIAQTTIRVRSTDNLQTIINNATAGSTLIVEAGNYGDITVNKRLNFTGPGYFLTTGTQATNISAIVGSVKFLAGSDNSTFTGFSSTSTIYIAANSIVVSKCYTGSVSIGHNGTSTVAANNNNIVKQCYLQDILRIYSGSFNFLIRNNITGSSIAINDSYGGQAYGEISFNTGISNNSEIYWSSVPSPMAYIVIKNNVCSSVPSSVQTTSSVYNVLYGNITGLPASNKINIPKSSIFVSNTNPTTVDALYQLSTTSPAKGAGENGVDCGAFGGDEPYVLSGLPSGPIVYELSVPTQVTPPSTLNIRVRAKVQN